MITLSFTAYGLIFIIIAALIAAGIVALILDSTDIICLNDALGTFIFVLIFFGMVALAIMGVISTGSNNEYYKASEYDIDQIIMDATKKGYTIKIKETDVVQYEYIEERILYLHTSLITGKTRYVLYIPNTDKMKGYRKEKINE